MIDCYVGAATGALKAISLLDNSCLNLNDIKQLKPKQDGITRMSWSSPDQQEIIYSTESRSVFTYHAPTSSKVKLFDVENGTGRVNGLYLTPNDQIVTALHCGAVAIADRKGNEIASIKGGQGILCLDGSRDHIAFGGKDNPIKVYNLERPDEAIWRSKNVACDSLDLTIPIIDNDVRLVPDSSILVTGTGTHHIRMYDMRAQRRPVRQAEFMETPISAISLSNTELQVFAGNTIGELGLFDLRGRTKILQVCKFKGQAGSIRNIYGHPTLPYVASCGIDRFVRVHDMNTRKLTGKIFCKVQLNRVLMRDSLSISVQVKTEIEEAEDEWAHIGQKSNKDKHVVRDESDDDEEAWQKISSDKPRESSLVNSKSKKLKAIINESDDEDSYEQPRIKKRRPAKTMC